jgi:hypothetical protein
MTIPDRACIGVWTETSRSAWHSEAYRLVYLRELSARLPEALVRFYGAACADRVEVADSGHLITPLTPATERAAWPHALVMAGVPLGHGTIAVRMSAPRQGTEPPTFWSGVSVPDLRPEEATDVRTGARRARYVSVRDPSSRHRLGEAGVDCDVDVIPDPLVLLPRLTSPDAVRSRLIYAQTLDDYPAVETVLIVEPGPALEGHAEMLSHDVQRARDEGYHLAIVVLTDDCGMLPRGLRETIDRIFGSVYYVRRRLRLEDLSAVIASAAGVIVSSPEMLVAAWAFGRPTVALGDPPSLEPGWHALAPAASRLGLTSVSRLLKTRCDPSAADPDRLQVDAHFDRLAEMLHDAHQSEGLSSVRPEAALARQLAQLERAHLARGRGVEQERLRFAQRAEGLMAEIEVLKADIARRDAVEARLRTELGEALAYARLDRWRREAETIAVAAGAHETAADDPVELSDVELSQQIVELRAMVRRFERSRSWRYLAPARAIGARVRRLLGLPHDGR